MKHISVLLDECINGLNIKENGIYVDMTLGYAGHSSEILKRLKNGFLYAFDKDIDVWGYGYKGYAYVNNGKIYMSNEEKTLLEEGDYAVILAKFPLGMFNVDENNIYEIFDDFDEKNILEEVKYSISLSLQDTLNIEEVIFKVDDEIIETFKEE